MRINYDAFRKMTRSDELILNVLDPENGEENDSFDVSEMAYVTIPDYNNYNRHHPKNISYIRPSSYDSLGEYTKTNLREGENGFDSKYIYFINLIIHKAD